MTLPDGWHLLPGDGKCKNPNQRLSADNHQQTIGVYYEGGKPFGSFSTTFWSDDYFDTSKRKAWDKPTSIHKNALKDYEDRNSVSVDEIFRKSLGVPGWLGSKKVSEKDLDDLPVGSIIEGANSLIRTVKGLNGWYHQDTYRSSLASTISEDGKNSYKFISSPSTVKATPTEDLDFSAYPGISGWQRISNKGDGTFDLFGFNYWMWGFFENGKIIAVSGRGVKLPFYKSWFPPNAPDDAERVLARSGAFKEAIKRGISVGEETMIEDAYVLKDGWYRVKNASGCAPSMSASGGDPEWYWWVKIRGGSIVDEASFHLDTQSPNPSVAKNSFKTIKDVEKYNAIDVVSLLKAAKAVPDYDPILPPIVKDGWYYLPGPDWSVINQRCEYFMAYVQEGRVVGLHSSLHKSTFPADYKGTHSTSSADYLNNSEKHWGLMATQMLISAFNAGVLSKSPNEAPLKTDLPKLEKIKPAKLEYLDEELEAANKQWVGKSVLHSSKVAFGNEPRKIIAITRDSWDQKALIIKVEGDGQKYFYLDRVIQVPERVEPQPIDEKTEESLGLGKTAGFAFAAIMGLATAKKLVSGKPKTKAVVKQVNVREEEVVSKSK